METVDVDLKTKNPKTSLSSGFLIWWNLAGSNRRPLHCQCDLKKDIFLMYQQLSKGRCARMCQIRSKLLQINNCSAIRSFITLANPSDDPFVSFQPKLCLVTVRGNVLALHPGEQNRAIV